MAVRIKDIPDYTFTLVENTNSNPSVLKYEYNVDPPYAKSVGTIQSVYELNDLISRLVGIVAPPKTICDGEKSSNPIQYGMYDVTVNGVYFAPDFPDFLLPKSDPGYKSSPQVIPNVITWGTVRKEPGTVSGPPFRGTQEVRPRNREYIALFSDDVRKYMIGESQSVLDGYESKLAYVNVLGQTFDHLVQYNIWSKSNYEAERLTEWFEVELMEAYRGLFREAGVNNILFDRRVRDDTIQQMKNGYHVRSVLYYVRTERIKLENVLPIERIDVKIDVESIRPGLLDSGGQSIDSDSERLIRKWINKNKFGGILNG